MLLLYTLLHRSDVVRVRPQPIRGGILTIEQAKTGNNVSSPVHPTRTENRWCAWRWFDRTMVRVRAASSHKRARCYRGPVQNPGDRPRRFDCLHFATNSNSRAKPPSSLRSSKCLLEITRVTVPRFSSCSTSTRDRGSVRSIFAKMTRSMAIFRSVGLCIFPTVVTGS